MSNIYYFNINYYCNSNCIFCFSSSTGENEMQINYADFVKEIAHVNPQYNDKVIFNGGEPTIHPDFYKMLNYINLYNTNVVIYSNAISVDINKIKNTDNITWIVPIHGYENTHCAITRRPNSYKYTMRTIKQFQSKGIPYALKFIINRSMISDKFEIDRFLKNNKLYPKEIILARLNKTKKSIINSVELPQQQELKNYVNIISKQLRKYYKLKYIDIPFCMLDNIEIKYTDLEIPNFYFNDCNKRMIKCNYFKDLMIGKHCNQCTYQELCELLSKTYLTLCYNKNWYLDIE